MDRKSILQALLDFSLPFEQLSEQLAGYPWDSEELVLLKAAHLVRVLDRFAQNEIPGALVETWANILECRDDVGFAEEESTVVASVLHVLANPVLEGPLTKELASQLRARLVSHD